MKNPQHESSAKLAPRQRQILTLSRSHTLPTPPALTEPFISAFARFSAPLLVAINRRRRHAFHRFSEECLSTLQFANRCRSVHNQPRVNKLGDGPGSDQRKLKKLQDEIQALRQGGGVILRGARGSG